MVKIVTDTGADLSPEVFERLGVTFLSIPVQIEGQVYKDQVDIGPDRFYEMLTETKSMPSTSRITPYEYEQVFKKELVGDDEIVCITFSSKLSAIYESAFMSAAAIDPERISVVDTKCASLGQGLVVMQAAKMAQSGKSKAEIVEEVTRMSEKMEHIFAVGSLEMLKRGGRISSSQAILGSLLKVIPILQFDDGAIVPLEKVRGNKKMFQFMLEVMEQRGRNLENQTIGISHADNLKMAEELARLIREKFNVQEVVFSKIGAAIGAHAGPKTLALFFQG